MRARYFCALPQAVISDNGGTNQCGAGLRFDSGASGARRLRRLDHSPLSPTGCRLSRLRHFPVAPKIGPKRTVHTGTIREGISDAWFKQDHGRSDELATVALANNDAHTRFLTRRKRAKPAKAIKLLEGLGSR